MLALIERQVERNGGVAAISYSDIEVLLRRDPRHLRLRVAAGPVARLRALSSLRRPVTATSTHSGWPMAWRNLDAVEAHRLAVQARLPLSGPLRVPKPRKQRATDSRRWRTSHLETGDDGPLADDAVSGLCRVVTGRPQIASLY